MKSITPFYPAGLAVMFLLAGCEVSEDSVQRPQAPPIVPSGSVVSSDDRLIGISLGSEDYGEYLSVREAEELHMLANHPDQLREIALDYHSDVVLARYAESEGLAELPLVQQRMEKARRDILLQALVDRVDAELTFPPEETLEQRVKERYQRTADEHYVRPGGRRVAQILLTQSNCRLRGTDEELLSIVAEIEARLAEGEDFAALAEEYSDDLATWRSGGVLPELIQQDGRTVQAFERAVFGLAEVGDVSSPIVTSYGVHLIRLEEIVEPESIPFEEVRDAMIAQEKERFRFSQLEQLRSAAYPDPQGIDVGALVSVVNAAIQGEQEAP